MKNRKNNDNDKDLIRAWLEKGRDDLLFAKTAFKEEKFYDQICCLCQQSVEKYIKAIILAINGKITKKDKIHNLNVLAKRCKDLIDLNQFDEELRMLTQAYIPARYPSETNLKSFSKEEAKKSIEAAEKIIKFIEEEYEQNQK